jgi:hypothetical protein
MTEAPSAQLARKKTKVWMVVSAFEALRVGCPRFFLFHQGKGNCFGHFFHFNASSQNENPVQ